MATTWAGTADNQLITRSALQDAVTNGLLILKSGQSISGTTQICTKSYISSVIDNMVAIGTWDSMSTSQCPKKSVVANSIGHQVSLYGESTGTNQVKVRFYRNGEAFYLTTYSGTTAGCIFRVGVGQVIAGDVLSFEFSTSTYENVQGYVNKGSSTCGAGTLSCSPVQVTVATTDVYDLKVAFAFKSPIVSCA